MGRPSLVQLFVPPLSTLAIVVSFTGSAAATTTAAQTNAVVSISPMLTHAQFVQRLDAICVKANLESAPIQTAYLAAVRANEPRKAGAILARRRPLANRWLGQLAGLKPPVKDQGAFARFKRQVQRIDVLLDRIASGLLTDDFAEVNRLAPLVTAAGRARNAAAVDLGTTHCGSG